MGVEIPSYHLVSSPDLPHRRKRIKGAGGRKGFVSSLTLTSMIDMFATLIFFLLHSFGNPGDTEFMNSTIDIPSSEHAMMLKRAPIITVSRDKITLEGGEDNPDSNLKLGEKIEETEWELPHLKDKLLDYKKFFESIHTEVKYPPEVILVADKELEFLYVKRVLFTLTKMGFGNVVVAVRGKVNVINEPGESTPSQ
jgi:biopolymer transport protein ExbD